MGEESEVGSGKVGVREERLALASREGGARGEMHGMRDGASELDETRLFEFTVKCTYVICKQTVLSNLKIWTVGASWYACCAFLEHYLRFLTTFSLNVQLRGRLSARIRMNVHLQYSTIDSKTMSLSLLARALIGSEGASHNDLNNDFLG